MMSLTSITMIRKFYQILFDPGQTTCFSETAFGTSVYYIDGIQETHPNYNKLMYLSVNSLHTHRYDSNVTCYRNFLIENDNIKDIKEQIALIKKLKMPYSTVTFSGSKSLHFIISLETPLEDEKMYRYIADWIHNIINEGLPENMQFDGKTKNPSRFSRVPSGTNVKYEKDENGELIKDGRGNPIIKSKTVQSLIDLKGRVPDEVMEAWLLAHEHLKPTVKQYDEIIPNDVANPLLLKKWTAYLLENGIHKGKRNTSIFEIANDLYQAGFQVEEAIKYIHDEAKHLEDFPFSEVETTIRSAYKGRERSRNES